MSASSKTAIYAALVGNSLIAITKFIAAGITGSSAMLSEGIHSLVDTGNQGLLLYGMKNAKKPPDEKFPFGHGKEIYFWSFIVAILIFAVGAGVSIYEGIHHILHPEPIKSVMINYIVLGLAIIFEGFALTIAIREFNKERGSLGFFNAVRQGKDPTLFVVVFEDTAAMLGLLVALVGITLAKTTGILEFDGIASVIIGFILAGTAFWLAAETKSLLIGEAAHPEIIKGIQKIATSLPEIQQVNEVLTLHFGPDFLLVNISANFRDAATADNVEDAIEDLETRIKRQFPEVKRLFVEAEERRHLRHRRLV